MQEHEEIISMLKLLIEMNERLIISIEAMTRPQQPQQEEEQPALWIVEIWSIDRGVKIGGYESDVVPEVDEKLVIAGELHVVAEVNVNAGSMKAKVKVKATGQVQRMQEVSD